MPGTFQYVFWQPWLKGYNGEWWGGGNYRWHDSVLKKQMTGQEYDQPLPPGEMNTVTGCGY